MSKYYKPKSGGVSGFFRRNSNTISLGIIALSIIAIFLLQAITISRLESEIAYQSKIVTQTKHIAEKQVENAKDRAKSIQVVRDDVKNVNDHMDCLVSLFTYPNRDSITIQQIKGCKLQVNSIPNTTPVKTPSPIQNTPKPAKNSQKTTTSGKTAERENGVSRPTDKSKGFIPSVIDSVKDLLGGVL